MSSTVSVDRSRARHALWLVGSALLTTLLLAGAVPAHADDPPTSTETVSGTAINTVGELLADIRVTLTTSTPDGQVVQDVTMTTLGDGAFSFEVPTGSQTICLTETVSPARVSSRCRRLGTSTTPRAPLEMVLTRIGSISGVVRSGGTPIVPSATRTVIAYTLRADGRGGKSWRPSQYTQVAADGSGRYRFDSLTDDVYRVCFGDALVPQGCAGSGYLSGATDLRVAGGATTADIALTVGTAHVTVTTQGSVSPAVSGNSYLFFYRYQPDPHGHPAWRGVATAEIASGGGVRAVSLPAGTYRMKVSLAGRPSEFYPHQATVASASDLVVEAGGVTEVSTSIARGASITGTVRAPAGSAPAWTTVTATDVVSGEVVSTTAGTGATYTLAGLRDGAYRVKFDPAHPGVATFTSTDFETQYFADVPESGDVASSSLVTVHDGEVRQGVDASLARGSVIVGQVVGRDGSPEVPHLISAYLESVDGTRSARVSVGPPGPGVLRVTGISAGSYRLSVSTGDGRFWYDGTSVLNPSGARAKVLEVGTRTVKDLGVLTSPGPQTAMTNLTPPRVLGSPMVNRTLTVDPGTWSAPGTTYAYRWFADGQDVPGATASTYRPVPSDTGKRIAVAVTASAPGYRDTTATSDDTASDVSPAPPFQTVPTPTISGDARVGARLTVVGADSGWDPAPEEVRYVWLRHGTPVPGATRASYVVSDADRGQQLAVRVTAVHEGYADRPVTTAPTSPVAAATLTSPAPPVISGSSVVGGTLVADPGRWTPPPVRLSYQWFAGTSPITGARSRTLVVPASLVGRTVTVRVTASRAGSQSVGKLSQVSPVITVR